MFDLQFTCWIFLLIFVFNYFIYLIVLLKKYTIINVTIIHFDLNGILVSISSYNVSILLLLLLVVVVVVVVVVIVVVLVV